VGSNTDNAAYDLSLHSQSVWAESLRDFPESYYMSIVGALSPQKHSSTMLHTLSLAFDATQKALMYALFAGLNGCSCSDRGSHDDQEGFIADIDTKGWLANGWDGFVTVTTQTRPFLSSLQHKYDQQSHGSHDCSSTTVRLPLSSKEAMMLPLGRQEVRPGIWHSTTLPIEHMRLVTACAATWECVWQAVRTFETSRRQVESSLLPLCSGTTASTTPIATARQSQPLSPRPPDMQRYDAYLTIHEEKSNRCVRDVPGALDLCVACFLLLMAGAGAVWAACFGDGLTSATHDKVFVLYYNIIGIGIVVAFGLASLFVVAVMKGVPQFPNYWNVVMGCSSVKWFISFSAVRVAASCAVAWQQYLYRNHAVDSSGWLLNSEVLLLGIAGCHAVELVFRPFTYSRSSAKCSLTLHTVHTLLVILIVISCCSSRPGVGSDDESGASAHVAVLLTGGLWCGAREAHLLLRGAARRSAAARKKQGISPRSRRWEQRVWFMVVWPIHVVLSAVSVYCAVMIITDRASGDESSTRYLLSNANMMCVLVVAIVVGMDILLHTLSISESFQIFWLKIRALSQ
jgi:hypothetical protein